MTGRGISAARRVAVHGRRRGMAEFAAVGARRLRALTAYASVVLAAACGGSDSVAPVIGEIRITPANPTVALTGTIRLTAVVEGGETTGRTFHWASDNAAVATVDANGLVTPHAEGSARIAASAAGRSGITLVQVGREPVARVEVTPASVEMVVGDTLELAVATFGTSETELAGRVVQLTSDAPTVVAVIDGLRLVGLAAGSARATATSEGVSTVVAVHVAPAGVATVELTPDSLSLGVGATARLGVLVRDRSGALMDPSLVTFSSSDEGIATVSDDGVVTAAAPGRADIVGTAGSVTATVSVEVVRESVGRVSITPTTVSVSAGRTTTLVATVLDAAGRELTGRQVVWLSTNPAVATVGDSGRVRGVSQGVAIITATVEGVTASAGVTVTRARVATITLTPADDTLEVGDTVTIVASLLDATGRAVPDATVTWASSAPDVATVAPSGLVTAVAPGTTEVTATVDGISSAASIQVEEAVTEPPPEEPPPEEPPPEEPPPEEPPPEEPPPEDPVPGAPSQIVIVSGDHQTGDRGSALEEKLVIRVTDDDGVPVPGVLVLWWADHGGTVSADAVLTGDDGTVSARWQLGAAPGEQRATAASLTLMSVSFRATAVDP